MPKIPLTIEQKRDKLMRDQLTLSQNRCLSEWNFGKISTWEGVFKAQGFGEDYIHQHFQDKKGILTFKELKDFLTGQKNKLEIEIKGFYVPKENSTTTPLADGHITPSTELANRQSTSLSEQFSSRKDSSQEIGKQVLQTKEPKKGIDEDYGLHKSSNEHCSLFWFQKRAIAEGWNKLMI